MENQDLRRRLLRLAAFAFVAAAFVSFHADAFFGGKVYLNRWIFRSHAPFDPAPAAALNPFNQNSDSVTHYFPGKYFIADSLKKGVLPLWNPRAFSGFPFYANGSSAVFSPFNLLLLKWEPYAAYNIVLAVVFLAGAGLFFIYLTRSLGLSAPAAAAGASALVFCPLLLDHIDFDALMMFVWIFPAVLLMCEKWRRDPVFPAQPVLTVVMLLGAMTAHVHTALNMLLLVLVYRTVLFRGQETPAQSLRRFAAVAALFLAVSAFVWLPVADFFTRSQFLVSPGPGAGLQWPLTPVTAVYPFLPKLPGVAQLLGKQPVSFGMALNAGLVPNLLGLAGLTFAFRPRIDARVRLFSGFAAAYHLLVFFPGNLFLSGIAGSVANVGLMKFWQIYVLSVAVLCAYGFDAVFLDDSFRRALKKILAALSAAVVAPALLFSSALSLFPDRFLAAARNLAARFAPDAARVAEQFAQFRELASLSSPLVWMPSVLTAALFWLVRSPAAPETKSRRRAALFIILIIDLFAMGLLWRPVPIDPKDGYTDNAVTDFLRRDPGIFRVMSIQSPRGEEESLQKYVLKPNLPAVYGLEDVGGQDSLLNGRYSYFAQKYLGARPDRPVGPGGVLSFDDVNLNAAGFLNVKYLVVSDARPMEGLREAVRGGGAVVYENPRLLPRFFFTRKIFPFEGEDEAFRLMARDVSGGEPEIALEGAAPAVFSQARAPRVAAERKPGGYVARVSAPDEGVLVFSENYDPGWRAEEAGRPLRVLRVNGLVCGVRLPPGEHEVVFEYRPAVLAAASIVSFFSLAGTALFFFLQVRRRRV